VVAKSNVMTSIDCFQTFHSTASCGLPLAALLLADVPLIAHLQSGQGGVSRGVQSRSICGMGGLTDWARLRHHVCPPPVISPMIVNEEEPHVVDDCSPWLLLLQRGHLSADEMTAPSDVSLLGAGYWPRPTGLGNNHPS
jgi:hypothetical protein